MSDKPISVGDLVVVIRGCCEKSRKFIGMHFHVINIERLDDTGKCNRCGQPNPFGLIARRSHKTHKGFALWRLKRIPPLKELEDTTNREEIAA